MPEIHIIPSQNSILENFDFLGKMLYNIIVDDIE